MNLPLGKRPVRPIGKARGFVEGCLGEFGDEGLVTRGITEAVNHRRDLRVEQRCRNRAGQIEEYFHVLACGVKHLEDILVCHQRKQRRQVDPWCERVDRRRFLGAGYLDEAEDRPIGALGGRNHPGLPRATVRGRCPSLAGTPYHVHRYGARLE